MNRDYTVICNLAISNFVDKSNSGVAPPAGVEDKIPPLWVGDSCAVEVQVYSDWSAVVADAVKLDLGATAATKLYLKRLNSAEDAVELCTGTVAQLDATGAYYCLCYVIPADMVPAVLVGACLLYGEVTGTAEKVTWAQELSVISEDGSADTTLTGKDIDVSIIEHTGSATLADYPGEVTHIVNATAETTLTPTEGTDAQMMTVRNDSASANVIFAATVDGLENPVIQAGESLALYWTGAAWGAISGGVYLR